jgi:hypothetical protein
MLRHLYFIFGKTGIIAGRLTCNKFYIHSIFLFHAFYKKNFNNALMPK